MRCPDVRICVLAAVLAAGVPAEAVRATEVGPVTSLPLPRYVSMRAEEANARRGPSLSHRVDWTFKRRSLPLEVTAEYGQWRRVRDVDGAGGWVHHSLLSGVRTVLFRGEGPVPLRAGAREGAAILAFVEPGVVAWLEECDPSWCRVAVEGVEGWALRGAVWGVGADEILE